MTENDPTKLPNGTILEGKFRITREIGRGGMAAVYEAENVDIGKRVAVKILSADLITSRVVRERFLREARAAAAIRSPYICDVYDSGTFEERPFLVMELLEGESLYEMQARERQLDIDLTLRLALQTARGLAKAHASSVVHRDLKPENIFLTRNEEGQLVAKIVDFGLAKFYESTNPEPSQARLTREGALFGTPAYMAPEQARGQGSVDHRCDLWALGCIVYECLTARTVWRVDQGVAMILAQIASSDLPVPSQVRPDLPASFDQWFAKALDRDPDRRFQTAKELAVALSASLASLRPAPAAGDVVDDLLHSDSSFGSGTHLAAANGGNPGLARSQEFPDAPLAPAPPAPVPLPTSPSVRKVKRARRLVSAGFIVAGIAVAGYVVWLSGWAPFGGENDGEPRAQGVPAEERAPLETEPWALQIGAAQTWLTKEEPQRAATMFREAFKNGGGGLARNLMSHAEAVQENRKSPCAVTGLGRPRPFDVVAPPSRPAVASTDLGTVVAWSDTHEDMRRRRAYSVLLDRELRRVTPAQLITPESRGVRHPQLFGMQNGLGLLYSEFGGDSPGVYVRKLHADGRIAGPAIRLSAEKDGEYYPTMLAAKDGTFWAFWERRFAPGQDDLVGRRLGKDLRPLAEPLRLTAFAAETGSVSRPDAAFIGPERLLLGLSLRLKKSGRVVALSIPYGGRDPLASVSVPARSESKDLHIGNLIPISTREGSFDQARVACAAKDCFIAWDDEGGGAAVASLDIDRKLVVWRHELGDKSSRPTLVSADGRVVMAWFENSRVQLARVTRDGLGIPTILGKVSGFQPYPALTAGALDGEWYVSWRDYESGHLEAMVARVRCEDASQGT